jgi:peptidoglycan L-alanyl-D-glutamate endopeptidase CwlK
MILHPERLQGVADELVEFVQEAAHIFAHEFDLAVVFGLRTPEQQEALYAKGRTIPSGIDVGPHLPLGRVVTNAEHAEDTPHGRGGAVDLCPVVHGIWQWEAAEKFRELGELAEAHGLVWGGRWASLRDMGHIQLPHWHDLPYPPQTEGVPHG